MKKRSEELHTSKYLTSWAGGLLVAIVVLMPLHTLLTVWVASNFSHLYLFSAWKELLLLVCLGLVVGALVYNPTAAQALKKLPLLWVIGGSCVLYLIYLVTAADKHQALIGSAIDLRFLITFGIAQIVVLLGGKRVGQWLVKTVLGVAAVLSLFAILQAIVLPSNVLEHVGYEHVGQHLSAVPPSFTPLHQNSSLIRAQATLRGPNALGAYLLIPLSISLVYLVTRKRLVYDVLSVLYLAGLFVTYSRSAWLGAVVVVVTVGLVRSSLPPRKLTFGFVSIALFFALGIILLGHNPHVQDILVRRTTDSNSNAGHIAATNQAIKEVIHKPFGQGPGTAGPASALGNHTPRIAENYFLQVAQEVGWLGLLLLLASHVLVLLPLWRQRNQPLVLALFASFLGLVLTNLFLHTWADETVALTWWGLAGLALQPRLTDTRNRVTKVIE